MKRIVALCVVLSGVLSAFAQQDNYQQFRMAGWNVYNGTGSSLKIKNDGPGIVVSGTASAVDKGGAGYVLETKTDIRGLAGRTRVKFKVSGITGNDAFRNDQLFKLEINGKPLVSISPGMTGMTDEKYVISENGEFIFDLSNIRSIRKIELVFWNLTVSNVRIEMFVE
jgi:hypothetical protein